MIELTSVSGDIFIIDDGDAQRLDGFRFYSKRTLRSGSVRAVSVKAYRDGKGRPLTHVLMDVPTGYVVDHINGDPLDNRRENLRVCTPKENGRNIRRPVGARLPFKGLQYRAACRTRPWIASIRFEGKRQQLGRFATPEEAHAAYRAAALKLYGEFARFD